MFKGSTATDNARGTTLANGDPNIACLEHLRSFIQSDYNNVFVTGWGDTIPLTWFKDGTIKWSIIWHQQTNGAELAFQIEGGLITHFEGSSDYHFGVHYINQGRFRGRGDVAGVHNVCVIAIQNAQKLLRDKMIGYPLNIRMLKLKIVMLHQESDLQHFVALSDEKAAVLRKKDAYQKSRTEIRQRRAAAAQELKESVEEEEEEESDEEGFTYQEEEVGGGEEEVGGGKKRAAPETADDDGDSKPAARVTAKKTKKARDDSDDDSDIEFMGKSQASSKPRATAKKPKYSYRPDEVEELDDDSEDEPAARGKKKSSQSTAKARASSQTQSTMTTFTSTRKPAASRGARKNVQYLESDSDDDAPDNKEN